jgi:AraC-like DNA-binding protein
MVIFFVATLPHLVSPWAHKVELATKIIQDSSILVKYNQSAFKNVPAIVIFLSRPLLILAYALWSTIMVVRYVKQKRGISVFSQQQFMTKWLTVLLAFLFILIFIQMLQIYQAYSIRNIFSFYTLNLMQILSGAGLTGLLISPFFFPTILYGLPRMPVSKGKLKANELQIEVLTGVDQKNLSSFEADYLQLIAQKADLCMGQLQPYLQTDCNMAYFAKLTNIPVHHIAYYFREVKKQSFSDFRNEWRVNHAKKLITEGKANELTLEAIGLLSGFSTRNTFFTAFKKSEGVSPGIFAAQFTE